MFYLKYRPHTIVELDNTNVKDELTKLLQSARLPHAFLFIGQKGTGKTSTARILAKAVNCKQNRFAGKSDSIEPCNKCASCTAIDNDASVDVVEMDAASNRGIEEIKSLIRESAFLPMDNKYRVFIIDEAHMITHDAFNALLKTLEEPPQSVIFILATTNLEKIPKTIRSRCFAINFGRAKRSDLLHMLKRICEAEKIKTDENLLKLIAKHSDHSFRDATKMLEELSIQHKLSLEEGKQFLGILAKDNLLEIIAKYDIKKSLQWIEEFAQAGGDFKHLSEQLLDELHKLLLKKNKLEVEDQEVDADFSLKEISMLIRLINEAYNNLKISPIESLPLEIAVVDFYNKREVKN